MFIKSVVELIYQGLGVAENGDPINLEITKTVRCDEMETFSSNYYNEQQRNMRTSRNLVVPTYLTEDIEEDCIRYELMFCNYLGKKYRIRNILKYKANRYSVTGGRSRQRMILDIQEVR